MIVMLNKYCGGWWRWWILE